MLLPRSRRRASRLALGGLLGLLLLPAGAARAKGMDSLADLAASVTDAVVNISAAQVTEEHQPQSAPKLPPGTPLNQLFEDFFNKQLRHPDDPGSDAPQARRSNSLGSGFIIDPSGIVVTDNHVIEGANDITVILTDGTKLKAEVLGRDSKIDIAVLSVKPDHPLKAVPFGDSDHMRVGDAVMAVGNPFGLGGTVTAGIVSARNRSIDNGPYDDFIQTDASINKGNSGGPLFDMQGEVIGVNTAILSPSGGSIGIGFATPANTVKPIIDQLRTFHEVRRGWLGVRIQPVTGEVAKALNIGEARGALIAGIEEAGPAAPAGLRKGDVIVAFDGHPIKEARDLPKVVAVTPVGKAVTVAILRDGAPQNLSVTVGRLDEGQKDAKKEAEAAPAPVAQQTALGMSLASLDEALRRRFSIKDSVKGVAVTAVDPSSAASGKVKPGEVVVEVDQVAVVDPADLAAKLRAAKAAGKTSALMLVDDAQGNERYVALTLE